MGAERRLKITQLFINQLGMKLWQITAEQFARFLTYIMTLKINNVGFSVSHDVIV